MSYRFLLNFLAAITAAATISCGRTAIPSDADCVAAGSPKLAPDYAGVTIPPNIAPLNFEIGEEGEEYAARLTGSDGSEITASGKTVKWDMDDWHSFISENRGKGAALDVFVKKDDGRWHRYTAAIKIATEEIDPFFSYRLIEPSFVQYGHLSLNQRNLTNFDTKVLFNNRLAADENEMSCMNCHVPRNQYRDRKTQFHVRQHNGGTIIIDGKNVRRVNLATDSTKAGVYQAWHPKKDVIAYSTNGTKQFFFTKENQKVEVLDEWSDIILYDADNGTVSKAACDPALLETFPAWNPEGTKLYYSVARHPGGDELKSEYNNIRYDIVSRNFDMQTQTLSETADTVLLASALGKSASLARISPDGRFLMTCMSDFGTFHIWHKNSDLWITDLSTGESRPLTEANSDDSDSYHSWSSNSRWVIFSSRRDDGSYTRPYISYISPDGKASKPFIVPQENPGYYGSLMKSFNVPEFMTAPAEYSRQDIVRALDKEPENAVFQ